MRIILPSALGFILSFNTAKSQKPIFESQEEVVAAAISELDSLVTNPKFLETLNKENVHGTYHFQIGIGDKGQINTMRAMERSEDASIHGQNYLNNLVKTHKFNFKLPKGNYYRFEYTFILP